MTHRQAVAGMLLVTLLWSIAGVVTRQLESARSLEVTFWRSAANALALLLALSFMRGRGLWRSIATGGWPLWVSGLCWAVMYTAFMVAIMLTTVANVLVTMAVAPLLAALFSRVLLDHRLPARTWVAIALAGAGIGWMFGHELGGGSASVTGTLVALLVPIAGAANWTLMQHLSAGRTGLNVQAGEMPPHEAAKSPDMLPAVLIGALLSSAVTLPLSLPFAATPTDLGLLGMLGVVQLAVPCLLAVRISSVLPAAEMSLLGLLEVILGVLWAWAWAGEQPGASALVGGAIVIAALAGNEALAMLRPEPRNG
jgi:drug/metabolite transporter (DMT)-like permease